MAAPARHPSVLGDLSGKEFQYIVVESSRLQDSYWWAMYQDLWYHIMMFWTGSSIMLPDTDWQQPHAENHYDHPAIPKAQTTWPTTGTADSTQMQSAQLQSLVSDFIDAQCGAECRGLVHQYLFMPTSFPDAYSSTLSLAADDTEVALPTLPPRRSLDSFSDRKFHFECLEMSNNDLEPQTQSAAALNMCEQNATSALRSPADMAARAPQSDEFEAILAEHEALLALESHAGSSAASSTCESLGSVDGPWHGEQESTPNFQDLPPDQQRLLEQSFPGVFTEPQSQASVSACGVSTPVAEVGFSAHSQLQIDFGKALSKNAATSACTISHDNGAAEVRQSTPPHATSADNQLFLISDEVRTIRCCSRLTRLLGSSKQDGDGSLRAHRASSRIDVATPMQESCQDNVAMSTYECFEACDRTGRGMVTIAEIRAQLDPTRTPDQVLARLSETFSEADTNGDGMINFEALSWLMSQDLVT
mmetsp:Transcript_14023/g.24674  ORF Transcript_14023/g.24674 Transcript_14023/m.24674 type:complete len:476 (+) Transcript_14023:2-1429(+)